MRKGTSLEEEEPGQRFQRGVGKKQYETVPEVWNESCKRFRLSQDALSEMRYRILLEMSVYTVSRKKCQWWLLSLRSRGNQIETTKLVRERSGSCKDQGSITCSGVQRDVFEILGYGSNLKQVKTNFTIVRGLAYYSDFIVETDLNFKVTNNKGKEIQLGSICSGGSYAKLISRFRGVDVPGTGISFGVDRLLFALMQLDQIKVEDQKPVLVCVMDEKYLKNYYEIVDLLRDNNINAEVFLSAKKNLGKQLDLANKRELTVAIICGENEFKDNTVTIKDLKGVKGENSQTIPKSNLINEIKKLI